MFPATPPRWVAREAEILAVRLILIYLESDESVREPYLWAIQDETGIEWVAFDSARRSARLAAEAWQSQGRQDWARRTLTARLGELMPA